MEKATDLRVYKTRKALCETFMELIKEKPFDDITIHELCEKALVRRATFYKHFADKYDFFSYFIRYYRSDRIGDFSQQVQNMTLQTYCTYHFDNFVEFIVQNGTLINNILKSNMLPVILDIFSEEIYIHTLEIIQKNKLLEKWENLSPELLSSFYAGGMVQILKQWIKNSTPISEEELKERVNALFQAFTLKEKPC